MITPTEPASIVGPDVPSFHLVLPEPARTVSVHLVSGTGLPPKALAVCLQDPPPPDAPHGQGKAAWSFSRRLESNFVYAPATEGPAVVSLPVAHLNYPAGALIVTVHPWAAGCEAAAEAISEVWFGVTRADESIDVSRVVRS